MRSSNLVNYRCENERVAPGPACLVPRIKPVPALQQIRKPRLFGIHDEEAVEVGELVHSRYLSHIFRIVPAAM